MNRIAWISVIALAISTGSARADMMGNANDGAGRAGPRLSAAYDQMLAASSVTLVTSIPSPCGGNNGLAWDGTYLWISDYDTRKAYQVDPATGAAVRSIPVPGTYPNGLAWDGSALWYVDSGGDTIYKLNPSDGTVLLSIPSPGHRPGGLEFDGTDLWCCTTGTDMASGGPDKIYRMTTSGVVVASFAAKGEFPTGLAFDGQFLWHADNVNNTIYKLHPANLSIVDSFPAPGDYPNDLAWDGRYLWVVDNDTDRLYKFDVEAVKPSVLVCGADDAAGLADVQQKLTGAGQFTRVDVLDVRGTTPTLAQLQGYDAVLVFNNTNGYQDPTAIGDVMADYVDAGGGVVCMMFEIAMTSGVHPSLQGRWNSQGYYAIPRGEQYQSSPRATLGAVHDPCHPIMQGVIDFAGGSSTFRPDSLDVATGSVRVADWSDGRPLVVTKIIGDTRRADLGFYPVSSDVRDDFWDASTDGALLMANALTWVSGSEAAVTPPTILFQDTFPSTTIDAGKWTGGSGANVDDVAMNEPSAPYSLRLNGHPSGGDSVESRVIDLSSCSAAVLTYYYQETGGGESPDESEDLIVEYHDGTNWVELDRQPGSGTDMTVFVKRTVTLPASALHAALRLRIRSIGTAHPANVYDDWFVDDVKIEAGAPGTAVTINFDDVQAPCGFADANCLTDQYASLGVTFEGPDGNDGGAILNQCGNFSVDGHSTPNFLAFNVDAGMGDGGLAKGPETLVFSPPVSNVVVSVAQGSDTPGELSIEAFDAQGGKLDAVTVTLSSHLTPVTVSAPGIVRVVVSSTAEAFVLDDLTFSPEVPLIPHRRSPVLLQAGQQEDTAEGPRMVNGQLAPGAAEP